MAPSKLPPFDPTAYAMKKKEQIERAKELRSARSMVLSNSPPRDPLALRRSSYPTDGTTGIPRRSRSRGASPPRRFGPNDPLSGNTRRARSRGASPPRRTGSLLETEPPSRRGKGFRKNSLPEDGPAMAFDERESSWLVGTNGKSNQDDLASFLAPQGENASSDPPPRTGRKAVSGPVPSGGTKNETVNSGGGHERRQSFGTVVVSTTPRVGKRSKESLEAASPDPSTPGSKDGAGGADFEGGGSLSEGKGKSIFARFRSSTMKLFRKGMGGGSPTPGAEPEPLSPSLSAPSPHSSVTPKQSVSTTTTPTGTNKSKAAPSDSTGTPLSSARKGTSSVERSHGFESPSKRPPPSKISNSGPGGTLMRSSSETTGGEGVKSPAKVSEIANRKKTGGNLDHSFEKDAPGSNSTATPTALKAARNSEGLSGRNGGGKGVETKGRIGSTTTAAKGTGGATGAVPVSAAAGKKNGKPAKTLSSSPSSDRTASESQGGTQSTKPAKPGSEMSESVGNGEAKEKATTWFSRSKTDGKAS